MSHCHSLSQNEFIWNKGWGLEGRERGTEEVMSPLSEMLSQTRAQSGELSSQDPTQLILSHNLLTVVTQHVRHPWPALEPPGPSVGMPLPGAPSTPTDLDSQRMMPMTQHPSMALIHPMVWKQRSELSKNVKTVMIPQVYFMEIQFLSK